MDSKRVSMLAFPLLIAALAVAPTPSFAGGHFIDSDDYKDGEEVVGKFLKDDAYSRMVEEITRNGEELDWGWVKAEGKPAKPKKLGFDLAGYKTVSIPPVQNFAGLVGQQGDLPKKTQEAFAMAMQALGLEVVEGKPANLELGLALVDAKRDSTYIYVGSIKPFVEIELRLRDVSSGEDLILLRNQAHSDNVDDAALRFADLFVKFLQ
jgi:hypothetical protein